MIRYFVECVILEENRYANTGTKTIRTCKKLNHKSLDIVWANQLSRK